MPVRLGQSPQSIHCGESAIIGHLDIAGIGPAAVSQSVTSTAAAIGPGRGYARCVDERSSPAGSAPRRRAGTCRRFLAAALTEGRLDLVEYDKRVATAYAAVYRDEQAGFLRRPAARHRSAIRRAIQPVLRPNAAPPPRCRRSSAGSSAAEGVAHRGWPLVIVMFVGALFLARISWFGPFAVLMLLFGLAAVIGGISAESERRGRRNQP